ncbi:putative metal-binding motif-containing protein [Algibacter sp. L4_22]|uniref:putative metal-binding motif-containing protein n=1 Tax=Algibacter sp. L4_22 TaxID=2942477 RepID=UPI00201B70B0|nr:putative metal-binding motif-containing protein [Algibacter sp. L4_22]MCL5130220.1 putative metal-binding motif-containing protein [Algibacter sp. L4_22]
MKNRFLKIILPIMLLVTAVFIIGSGCTGDPSGDWFEDADGDGYGDNGSYNSQYDQPQGYVADNTDCDDTNASVYPGATEIPDNLIDEDCNDLHAFTFYHDEDGDGFGNSDVSEVIEIVLGEGAPENFVTNNADCNDKDPNINPIADEIYNNEIDDNCNGEIDTDDITYVDDDGDGYGSQVQAEKEGVYNALDCDDTNSKIHPYALEIKDGIDNDCDGIVDEVS